MTQTPNTFFGILWARLRSKTPYFVGKVQRACARLSLAFGAVGGYAAYGDVPEAWRAGLAKVGVGLMVLSGILAAFGAGAGVATSEPHLQQAMPLKEQ